MRGALCLLPMFVFACAADADRATESAESGEQNASAGEPAAPAGEEGGDDAIRPSPNAHGVAGAPGHRALLEEANRILRATKTTDYAHATYVDETSGTFLLDCSGFVDYALANVLPDAYAQLQNATAKRPVAKSYVSFVGALDYSVATATRWRRVVDARALVGGDIVAWLPPADSAPTTNTGHVMIASSDAEVVAGEIRVDVIDASESGHGKVDARTAAGAKGLGTGRIAITIDASGAPTGYRWSTESYSLTKPTTVVIAHLD